MFVSSSPRAAPKNPVLSTTSAIQKIPFSTSLSHLTLELGMNDSAASSPVRSEPSSGAGSFREQEQERRGLEEENFRLKLRVYMLEERLQRQEEPRPTDRQAAEMKVLVTSLQEELTQKRQLLRRASETLEALELQQAEQAETRQTERRRLQQALEADRRQRDEAEAERARLQAELEVARWQTKTETEGRLLAEDESKSLEETARTLRRQLEQKEKQGHANDICRQGREKCEASRWSQTEQDWIVDYFQENDKKQKKGNFQSPEKPLDQLGIDQCCTSTGPERQTAAETVVSPTRGNPTETVLTPAERNPAEAVLSAAERTSETDRPGVSGNCNSVQCAAGRQAASLRRQLAAAMAETRRGQAVAAAALQLQTERARSLQARVEAQAAQLRQAQAQLSRAHVGQEEELCDGLNTSISERLRQLSRTSSSGFDVIEELQMPELLTDQGESDADWETALQRPTILSKLVSPPPPGTPQKRQQSAPLHTPCQSPHQSPCQSPCRTPSKEPQPLLAHLTPSRPLLSGGGADAAGPEVAADYSDCDTWSEPDRDVSRARIGLETIVLEPPTDSWTGHTSDTDHERAGARQCASQLQEVQDLQARVEALHQVREYLCDELGIYQQLSGKPTAAQPLSGERTAGQQQPPTTPEQLQLLLDIRRLHVRLEGSVAQLGGSWPPPREEAAAARLQTERLRARLQQAWQQQRRSEHQTAELRREQRAAASTALTLQQRLSQVQAERDQLVAEQSRQAALLGGQLTEASRRQAELELLVRQLTQRLHQPDERRLRRAEAQLLTLGRQRLQLLAEAARLRARCRLLRTEASLHKDRPPQLAADNSCCGTHGMTSDSDGADLTPCHGSSHHLAVSNITTSEHTSCAMVTSNLSVVDSLGRSHTPPYCTSPTDGRLSPAGWQQRRARLKQRLAEARAAEQRLRRHLGSGQQRLRQYLGSGQQRLAAGFLDTVSSMATEYDDAGHSCPESMRSSDLRLPAAAAAATAAVPSSHSESEHVDELAKRGRPVAYSSPDLGIESDCRRSESRTSSATVLSHNSCAALPPRPPAAPGQQQQQQQQHQLTDSGAALQRALGQLAESERRRSQLAAAVRHQLTAAELTASRARRLATGRAS